MLDKPGGTRLWLSGPRQDNEPDTMEHPYVGQGPNTETCVKCGGQCPHLRLYIKGGRVCMDCFERHLDAIPPGEAFVRSSYAIADNQATPDPEEAWP